MVRYEHHMKHGGDDFMCGRYTVFTEDEIIEMRSIIAEVERIFGENSIKTGEIFPTNTAPVLIWEENRLAPKPVCWGYPRWNGGGAVINARAETALDKTMFRKPLLTRRCVIPSTGFYEWKHVEGKKQKDRYLLREPKEKMLYMAGMINTFAHADGRRYDAFCVLTTAANESVSPIHDRMPVILHPEEREAWLRDDTFMMLVLARAGPALVLEQVVNRRSTTSQNDAQS